MRKELIIIILILAASYSSNAQSLTTLKTRREMHVDMPDETEETDIVKKNELQIETAVLYNTYKDSSNSFIAQGLIRYGLNKTIEVRLLFEDGRNRDTYIEQTVQSTSPLSVGAKIQLVKDKEWFPDLTFVSYLKLPFTSRAESQRIYWSPVFLLAFQNKITDGLKLEYNVGLQQQAYSSDWQWTANASLHYKLTDALEVFGEYYAQYMAAETPIHNLGAGIAYQMNNCMELYMAGGTTIDYKDYNKFISGGIALRVN